ncbi:MAG: radical SAM family heme chaperone HemW [Pseudomonadales bacterium]|nr:radical SAM family heme chaperone HemW [Pseudomonadales bacterium]
MSEIPLSLYLHFPWCERKCPYCDFNSHEAGNTFPEKAYVNALLADLDFESRAESRAIHSVFLGGGTPSLFSANSISRVLAHTSTQFMLTDDVEITLEANPGAIDNARIEGFRQAGVNRLSIGVQSFDDKKLHQLGRIHSAAEASEAFHQARRAGFNNINLDLMHGLPGQTWREAEFDLQQAISLAPEHISWYQLTIEPNTIFYNNPPRLPIEETLVDIYERGMQLLADHDYTRYEIAAFARPGRQSVHNQNYWQFGDYLGVGAGAHGKLTVEDMIYRTTKTRLPKDYMASSNRKMSRVTPEEIPLEFLMNALRLTEGVDLTLFENRTFHSVQSIKPFLQRAEKNGFLSSSEDIKPTSLGLQFVDEMLLLV